MRDQNLLSLSYMKDFRCLGPECEDICCKNWRISLDREDVERLEGLRAQSPLLDARLDEAVVLETSGTKYAVMGFDSSGHCHFEQGGLCALHRDFGEEALPKTCATYPRKVLRQDGHFLVSGSLSCPEVARLCLLRENAMEIEDFDWTSLPPRIELIEGQAPPQAMYLIQCIRQAVLQLLVTPGRSLAEAIYLVTYVARKLDAMPGDDPQLVPRIEALLSKMKSPLHQARLLQNLEDRPDPNVARRFLSLVLGAKARHVKSERYNELVARVVAGYHAEAHISTEAALEQLWPLHRARGQALQARFGQRLNQYLTNYSLNYWHQERLGMARHFSAEARQFVLSFAVVKFLILGHPEIAALATVEKVGPVELARLDQAAVESVQIFSRNISHNAGMLDYLTERMERGGMLDVSELYSLVCL